MASEARHRFSRGGADRSDILQRAKAPSPLRSAGAVQNFVGGNTKVYGAALFRLREKDFEPFQHRDGISPEWPIKYRDWENYFTQAEELYQVHGKAGEDPTEPWRSKDYPFPPMSHEPRIKEVFAAHHRRSREELDWSVLDLNCRAHGVDNLYVVDGSFFVSSGAVNPTLTIIANALRVADHLLERRGAQNTAVKRMPGTFKQPRVPEMAAIA